MNLKFGREPSVTRATTPPRVLIGGWYKLETSSVASNVKD